MPPESRNPGTGQTKVARDALGPPGVYGSTPLPLRATPPLPAGARVLPQPADAGTRIDLSRWSLDLYGAYWQQGTPLPVRSRPPLPAGTHQSVWPEPGDMGFGGALPRPMEDRTWIQRTSIPLLLTPPLPAGSGEFFDTTPPPWGAPQPIENLTWLQGLSQPQRVPVTKAPGAQTYPISADFRAGAQPPSNDALTWIEQTPNAVRSTPPLPAGSDANFSTQPPPVGPPQPIESLTWIQGLPLVLRNFSQLQVKPAGVQLVPVSADFGAGTPPWGAVDLRTILQPPPLTLKTTPPLPAGENVYPTPGDGALPGAAPWPPELRTLVQPSATFRTLVLPQGEQVYPDVADFGTSVLRLFSITQRTWIATPSAPLRLQPPIPAGRPQPTEPWSPRLHALLWRPIAEGQAPSTPILFAGIPLLTRGRVTAGDAVTMDVRSADALAAGVGAGDAGAGGLLVSDD